MNTFKNFWKLISKKEKIKFFFIIQLYIFQALFELIGIASVIPFVTFLLQPEKFSEIAFISNFKIFNEIQLGENFIIILCVTFFSIF